MATFAHQVGRLTAREFRDFIVRETVKNARDLELEIATTLVILEEKLGSVAPADYNIVTEMMKQPLYRDPQDRDQGDQSQWQRWIETTVRREGLYPERAIEKGIKAGYDGGEIEPAPSRYEIPLWGLSLVRVLKMPHGVKLGRVMIRLDDVLEIGGAYVTIRRIMQEIETLTQWKDRRNAGILGERVQEAASWTWYHKAACKRGQTKSWDGCRKMGCTRVRGTEPGAWYRTFLLQMSKVGCLKSKMPAHIRQGGYALRVCTTA